MISSMMDFATSMRPDFHRAVIDTISHYGWNDIIYLYHSYEGMLYMHIANWLHYFETIFFLSALRMQ